jgi:hypothetical protein
MPRPRLLTVPGLLLALAPFAAADGPDQVGYNDLNKEYTEAELRATRGDLLRSSDEKPIQAGKLGDKKHEAALDSEAKWLAYRLYYSDFHSPSTGQPGEKSIDRIFGDLDGTLRNLTKNKGRTGDTNKMFADALSKRAKETMNAAGARPITVMNAARLLAAIAPLGQGQVADVLTEVVKAPPQGNEGAQYWACRGLRDLLAQPGVVAPPGRQAAALALNELILKPVRFQDSAPEAEKDGYRHLRREAVRALAETRVPSYGAANRPALTLLKVMARDGDAFDAKKGTLPRIDERVEAAIGLARMRPADKPEEYCPDYAAYHIGLLVIDFASYYQTEYKPKPADKRPLPCQVLAARLVDELEKLRAEVADGVAKKAAAEALKALAAIESGGNANTAALGDALKGLTPPNKTLFKGATDSAVTWRAEAAP